MSLIPRLHDEARPARQASSSSWLVKLARRASSSSYLHRVNGV